MSHPKILIKFISLTLIALGLFFWLEPATAAAPAMGNWFQLHASPYTGADDTGDGGTGNAADYNYYYVGQTFTANIQIKSENTSAANIWIDYDPLLMTASNIQTGTYFSSWSGQTLTGSRVMSTGFNISGFSSGTSTNAGFGSVNFAAIKPTAAAYAQLNPAALTINVGVIGDTTESNISYLGADLLQEVENFNLHIWADTKAPYAKAPNPANGAASVSVSSNMTFELRDSKNGAGDDTGVGVGVNTAMPHGAINVSDHFATSSYASVTGFSCSGIWGTSLCNTTLSPASPSGIPGDTRRWKYDTEYIVEISGFRDYASAAQNQLGDANGPNILATTTFSFTTEADTAKPAAANKVPAAGSSGIAANTAIAFDILDKKSASVSGTGVNPATCDISIQSLSFTSTTYRQGSAGVAVTATNYGYHYVITPATSFGENETVTVNIHDCQDLATLPNTMVTDIYTFTTADSGAPYVDDLSPADDSTIATNAVISFHLKDSGVGSSLANTIVYVNGSYYTSAGGAGSVSVDGKTINFVASVFATSATSTTNDYYITVTPAVSFIAGESIPVIIFARDTSGNIMDYEVYGYVVAGGAGGSGSIYCGTNTTWDAVLAKCVGTGGGTGGTCTPPTGGGGSPSSIIVIYPENAVASQINESAVLITWYSNLAGSSRVVYGAISPTGTGTSPNYDYQYSTPEIISNSTYHSVVVSGLTPGKLYYFRPVTKVNGNEVVGSQLSMAPKFGIDSCPAATPLVCPPAEDRVCPICPTTVTPSCPAAEKTCPSCPTCPVCLGPSIKPAIPSITVVPGLVSPVETDAEKLARKKAASLLQIISVKSQRRPDESRVIIINGTSQPLINLKLRIY